MTSEERAMFSWPPGYFGSFRKDEKDAPYFPLLSDFTDPSWDVAERDRVLNYLNTAPGALASSGMSSCFICGAAIPAAVYKSDGEWLWHVSLTHLIECHQVRVPNEFVESIRRRDYTPPSKCPVPVKDLPWPLPPDRR